MLEYMHVKNLALIRDCEISFEKGLNILTGETGAGKSVLLGSVNLALGAKADKDSIRTGEEEAYVELVFSSNDVAENLLREMELSVEDSIIISRKITPTKSVFKINGETVPARQVKELAGGLLDVHGQHEHQSLLSNSKQLDMLDAFGGEKISVLLEKTGKACDKYIELLSELKEAENSNEGREREISLLKYECREIEEASLVAGEDEELEAEYKRMQSSEKLLSYVNEAMALISAGTQSDAGSLVSKALNDINRAASLDPEAESMADLLKQAESLLGDFALEASEYADKLEFSPERFSETENRLDVINSLKAKFGPSTEDVLNCFEDKSKRLEMLLNLDTYLENLRTETEKAKDEYVKSALELSRERKETAKEFAEILSAELLGLSFLDASFGVDFVTDENTVSRRGMDSVEFMISTNPGEPRKPMKNVSSGGELSRIMLAIKTILAQKDEVDALIFDEIDAGISGRTAWEVSGRLSKLAAQHQVIAITHLAQIASAADAHFEIKKTVDGSSTTTNIYKLDFEGEIMELARLLGTDEANEATISNARELKKKADERKRAQ